VSRTRAWVAVALALVMARAGLFSLPFERVARVGTGPEPTTLYARGTIASGGKGG